MGLELLVCGVGLELLVLWCGPRIAGFVVGLELLVLWCGPRIAGFVVWA